MRRTALMIVASVLFVTTVAFAGVPGRFMHYPDINGDTVVFSYEGDLFSVSTAGGPARRLTNYPGRRMRPSSRATASGSRSQAATTVRRLSM